MTSGFNGNFLLCRSGDNIGLLKFYSILIETLGLIESDPVSSIYAEVLEYHLKLFPTKNEVSRSIKL